MLGHGEVRVHDGVHFAVRHSAGDVHRERELEICGRFENDWGQRARKSRKSRRVDQDTRADRMR